MGEVQQGKTGKIRSWWGSLPPCIRRWIKVVVLPVVSALLMLSVWGYWTYIQRGQWTPDHLLGAFSYLFDGMGSVLSLVLSALKAIW